MNKLSVLLLSLFVPILAFSQGAVPTLGNYGIFGNQTSARVSIFQNSTAQNGPNIELGGNFEGNGAIYFRAFPFSTMSSTNVSHAFQIINTSSGSNNPYQVGLISTNGKVWFGPQSTNIPSNFGSSGYSNLTLKSSPNEGSVITLDGFNNASGRNRITFLGNDLNIFESDDIFRGFGNEETTPKIFSFYSKFQQIRTRNTELRVHGKSGWADLGRYISMSYIGVQSGTEGVGYGLLATDHGPLILSPGQGTGTINNVGIQTNEPLATLHIKGNTLIGEKAPTGDYAFGNTTYTLAVEGIGVFQAVAVTDVNEWADFVFKPEYKLLDLKKVEAFIAQNGHLPDVPSEKEVRANGYNVNEMDAKLLQKVEELTLYIIDLQKQVDALKQAK